MTTEALKAEALELSKILAGMTEGGYADLDTLYTSDQADGNAFVCRAAEVLAALSATPPESAGEADGKELLDRCPHNGARKPHFMSMEAAQQRATQREYGRIEGVVGALKKIQEERKSAQPAALKAAKEQR